MTDEKIPDPREPAVIQRERAAFPSLYCALWPDLVAVAREHGYALLIHGSLKRDLDLVAVPWVEEAAAPGALVEALRAKTDAWVGCVTVNGGAKPMPHGRTSFTLMLGGHAYVDLSVMPCTPCP